MSRIVLGETDAGAKVHLDVDSLIRNRLLVQANSGRGKSSYPLPGEIMLTELGLKAIGGEPASPSQYEVQERILRNCDGPEQKILAVILAKGKGAIIPAQEVAESAGYSLEGGAFGNPRGRLRTKGLIEYPSPGHIKAAPWLFFES